LIIIIINPLSIRQIFFIKYIKYPLSNLGLHF